MKGFPHTVTIVLNKTDFSNLLSWLRDHGHELRVTMSFGENHHSIANDFVTQKVHFRDGNDAMLFKLAWGGK